LLAPACQAQQSVSTYYRSNRATLKGCAFGLSVSGAVNAPEAAKIALGPGSATAKRSRRPSGRIFPQMGSITIFARQG